MGNLSDLIFLDRFLHSATGEEPVSFSRNDEVNKLLAQVMK